MTRNDIESIYKEISKRNNVSVGIDKISVKAAKKNGFDVLYIDKVFDALKSGTYRFTKYKQLLQVKSVDKLPRSISIPCLRDRLLFKTIYEFYLKSHVKRAKFEEIIRNIHIDSKCGLFDKVAKFDIKNFYDSIPHLQLKKALKAEGIDDIVIELLAKAMKVKTIKESENSKKIQTIDKSITVGVPQGIIVGNAIAEIYAQQFDEIFQKEELDGKLKYHRFVDDILIFYNSSKINDDKLEKLVKATLVSFGLVTQPSKTVLGLSVISGFDFLGFVFKKDIISISKKVINRKEKKIERVIFDFAKSTHNKIKNNYKYLVWKLNLEITGFVANSIFYGWTSSYRFINDYGIFYRLDYVTKTIYQRAHLKPSEFVNIKSFLLAHNKVNKVKRKKTNYIPNFDTNYSTTVEKRIFLSSIYGLSSTITNEHVEELFDDIVKKEIYEVERDLDLKYGI